MAVAYAPLVALVALCIAIAAANAEVAGARVGGMAGDMPLYRLGGGEWASTDDTHTLKVSAFYPDSRVPPNSYLLIGTDLDWQVNAADPPFRPLPQAIMQHSTTQSNRWDAAFFYPSSMQNTTFNFTILIKRELVSSGAAAPHYLDDPFYFTGVTAEHEDDVEVDSTVASCLIPGAMQSSMRAFHVVLDGDTTTAAYPYFCIRQGVLHTIPDVYSPEFDNTRSIYIYQPPSLVENSLNRDVKVMFWNDGQLLPDYLVEIFDTLTLNGNIEDALQVGIESSRNRGLELTPTQCKPCPDSPHCYFDCECKKGSVLQFDSGEADQYFDFIRDTVLPLALKTTNKQLQPGGAFIGGYSYGGLNACYGAFTRPDQFAGAYCGSPSLWWNCEELTYSLFPSITPAPTNVTLYLDVGTGEMAEMVNPAQDMYDMLVELGFTPNKNVWLDIIDGDYHLANCFVSRAWKVLPILLGSFVVRGGIENLLGG